MSEFFGSAWWLLVTLGVLITFHEFGHFVIARRCGVKVLKFSVGFGKALWSRFDRKGTQYVIAAIPLGGYVKMLDEREITGAVGPKGLEGSFNRAPVGKRIAITLAGPVFNLVFTIVALWLVMVIGRPDYPPIVGETTGLAAAAGFQNGDRIVAIDGDKVQAETEVLDAIVAHAIAGRPASIAVETANGTQATRTLALDRLSDRGNLDKAIGEIGLKLKAPPTPAVAAKVMSGMPAAAAGLQPGDRITTVNGIAIPDFDALGETIQKEAAKSPTLALTVDRGTQKVDLKLTAVEQTENGKTRWIAGIERPDTRVALLRYGALAAIPAAFKETWHQTTQMLTLLGGILTGQSSPKNISGIITIGQVANSSAQMGLAWFINFLALVSLSLAVMNLLPIPILDGGQLLYYLIELVKGSPLSDRAQIAGQYVGMVLIVALMGLAFYNDILRIVS